MGNLFKSKTESVADTEFVIYLVPLVQSDSSVELTEEENLSRLKKKYEKVIEN